MEFIRDFKRHIAEIGVKGLTLYVKGLNKYNSFRAKKTEEALEMDVPYVGGCPFSEAYTREEID